MQPLSYQILPNSCWVTSMLNALLLLHGDKNKMSELAYKFLHTVLTDDGVCTSGKRKDEWVTVLDAIQKHTNLYMKIYMGSDVDPALRRLKFRNQIAVCDIDSGGHVILLSGRSDGWLEVFDPDWHNVKKRRTKTDAYIVQPEEVRQNRRARINLLINEDYLLKSARGRKAEFQMGAVSTRSLTVLGKRR